MTPFSEILRRKRLARTPGFAGGDLETQVAGDAGGADVLTPANRVAITRPRRTVQSPPKDLQRVYDAARAASKTPIPPELADVAIGEDYEKEHPGLYRVKQGGDDVSISPLDMEQEARNPVRRSLNPLRRQGSPIFSSNFPTAEVPVPLEAVAEPDTERRRAVTFDPATGKPNETYYREKDDIEGLYDATRNWEPRGAKRGFKNSLKSALLMGAEAVNRNPDHPVAAALGGLAVGAGAGTAAPNFLNRLRRRQSLEQIGGELKNKLELDKAQAQIDAGQMVPVELDNGETVMVPAKAAGSLRSRQQEIDLRGDTLTARKKRWDSLSSNERRRAIIAEYKAGMLNHDPAALEQAARELNIPGQMLPAFIAGQMRDAIDDDGNLIEINRQTGTVTPTGTQSYETTKEAGRETRSKRATQAADARTRYIQGEINQRTSSRPRAGRSSDLVTSRKAAELIGKMEQRRRTMTRADELLKTNSDDADARAMREKAQAEGEGFAAELNALDAGYEAGPGTLGYPYYKRGGNQSQPSGRYAGQRISVANLPEAAKRLGVSVEEARRILESEGATIYE